MSERLSRLERYSRGTSKTTLENRRTRVHREEKTEKNRKKRSTRAENTAAAEVSFEGPPLKTAIPPARVEPSVIGEEENVMGLPARRELFPSQRLKWTRWFFNSLLYMFVIILVFLLWWGVSDSPWGQSHGL
ncbi:hypothetical protein EHV15_28175 [Paenibacillus oralis]|uniref:Uncharacterized protein n=1 Tax=Paenibacillus oralis TaxID=2490856 RepID=A0A3P3UD33_9BACL|nr:hypothetical protein [Paenibacillus oralis]RRJ66363.1 hypothetical protein EHV15_28175 [Paenibacillus oralis]